MITDVTSTSTTTASDAMKQSMGMNKDDFLKLFIAQLQYQDPLAPQDPTAMLDQLSQLSLLEQSYNTNTTLNSLLTAQTNSATMSSVSFIGKEVKANGNSISLDGTSAAALVFNLPAAAAKTEITITNAAGKVVRTATLEELQAGDRAVSWDGYDDSGAALPAGVYHFKVTGTTASGTTFAGTTYTYGKVDGVSFANGNPTLTIGEVTVALSDVINVMGG